MQAWQIIAVMAILLWFILRARKQAGYRNVINRRVVIKYLDHNPDIAFVFPLTGTLSRQVRIRSTVFFVVELDQAFEYEGGTYEAIIIREKTPGQIPGYHLKTNVHVLVPKVPLDKLQYAFEDFEQVVWGVAEPLEA